MSAPWRVRLRTIAARQAWDGRKARDGSGFIPGIRHFQSGVRGYRAAAARGDADAAVRLQEIEAALGAFERSLDRWCRGLAGFVSASLDGEATAGAKPGGWRRSARLLRIRAPETRRLAALIARYDAACVDTAAVTGACRAAGIANPHRVSIEDRRRRLRALMALGYGGVRLRTEAPGRASSESAADADGGGPGTTRGDRPRPR